MGYFIDTSRRDQWKTLPILVRERFEEITLRSINEIESENDVFDYLEGSCFRQFLKRNLAGTNNYLKTIIELIESRNLTISSFFQHYSLSFHSHL